MNDTPIIAARIAGATSVGLTSMTWIAQLNEILQLVATSIAIISGCFAAWWYYEKAKHAREERQNESKN